MKNATLRRLTGVLLGVALAVFAPYATALTPHEQALSPEQEARYRTMIHELRCLVCQNQTIADSNAELALDLRRQVHERILAGATDDDIRTYVTDRYGDFVLYNPPMTPRTVLLWLGPFLILAMALVIALRLLRRRPAAPMPPAPAANAGRVTRILDEEA